VICLATLRRRQRAKSCGRRRPARAHSGRTPTVRRMDPRALTADDLFMDRQLWSRPRAIRRLVPCACRFRDFRFAARLSRRMSSCNYKPETGYFRTKLTFQKYGTDLESGLLVRLRLSGQSGTSPARSARWPLNPYDRGLPEPTPSPWAVHRVEPVNGRFTASRELLALPGVPGP
jgi:hypothetical protein